MTKQILSSDEARSKILSGMEVVAKTVSVTMWPKWRNVIFEKSYGWPQITNDWVTIANEIEVEDKFESLWAELVKEAADKTNTIAWDGTTTATLLTYALASEGLKHLKSWVNAIDLKNGMKIAAWAINEELNKNAVAISSKEEVAQVATLSAQDSIVWEIIAEAVDKVWNNWVITVEEGQTFGLSVDITEGMEFDQGYISPYMVTNPEKMLAEYKNAPILISDDKISNMKELLPLLESLMQTGKKDLIIIAEDVDWEALTTLVLNSLKGVLNVLCIKAPGFWDAKKEMLKDIAILTWANMLVKDLGMKLENMTQDDLWSAKSIISTKDRTTIISWAWTKDDIDSRVSELKNAIESTSGYEREKLQERLAKLAGWVAVIKVWAASEVEMKEKKLRIEDALNATRAAIEEWVVAWGWISLFRWAEALTDKLSKNKDEQIWINIVKNALVSPLKQIIENGGKDSSVIIKEITWNKNTHFWYDAANDDYVDMIKAGIIDPKKVERVALQEAVSLAWMFLTTEAAITNKPGKWGDCCGGSCSAWGWWMPMWGMWWMWGMPMM